MFQANVYRIMIGCPSDITDEKDAAFRVLNNWNNLNSEKNRTVLLPIHWSINSYPAVGKHPQKLLNEQLVEKSDLMVCIFGMRLGSPTDTEISGTVEEFKEHRKAGKDVMVFFKNSCNNLSAFNAKQWEQLSDFKESIKNDVFWQEFSDVSDFERKLSNELQLFINNNWSQNASDTQGNKHSTEMLFSSYEKQVITKWVESGDATGYSLGFIGGDLFVLGNSQYEVADGRKKAEWDDFMERLIESGLVEIEEFNNHGEPVYKLKKAAYDYVDKLSAKGENFK